jgi:hypothetical protein
MKNKKYHTVATVPKSNQKSQKYQGHPDRKPDLWNTDRYIHHTQVLLECYCIKMESSQYEN